MTEINKRAPLAGLKRMISVSGPKKIQGFIKLMALFLHLQFLAHDTDFSSPLARFEFQGQLNEVWMPISVPKVS